MCAYLTSCKKQINIVEKKLDSLAKDLKNNGLKFDYVCVRGISGIMFVASFCRRFQRVSPFIVRKGEDSHGRDIEFDRTRNGRRVLIFDDFAETGDTINKLRESVESADMKVVGIVLYKRNSCYLTKTKLEEIFKVPVFM